MNPIGPPLNTLSNTLSHSGSPGLPHRSPKHREEQRHAREADDHSAPQHAQVVLAVQGHAHDLSRGVVPRGGANGAEELFMYIIGIYI